MAKTSNWYINYYDGDKSVDKIIKGKTLTEMSDIFLTYRMNPDLQITCIVELSSNWESTFIMTPTNNFNLNVHTANTLEEWQIDD